MGTLLSYLVIYIIYIIIAKNRIQCYTNYEEKMAARSKKRFQFENIVF